MRRRHRLYYSLSTIRFENRDPKEDEQQDTDELAQSGWVLPASTGLAAENFSLPSDLGFFTTGLSDPASTNQ